MAPRTPTTTVYPFCPSTLKEEEEEQRGEVVLTWRGERRPETGERTVATGCCSAETITNKQKEPHWLFISLD